MGIEKPETVEALDLEEGIEQSANTGRN